MPKRTDIHKILVNMLQESSVMSVRMQFCRHLADRRVLTLLFSLLKRVFLRNAMLKFWVHALKQLSVRRTESFSRIFAKSLVSLCFRQISAIRLKRVLKLQEKSAILLYFARHLPLVVQAVALQIMKKNAV